jgi:hypothetical protein
MSLNAMTERHKPDMRGWKADEMFWEGQALWAGALRRLATSAGGPLIAKYAPTITQSYKHAVARCESPIEVKLLTSLFGKCWTWNEKPIFLTYCKDAEEFTNSPGRVCLMNQCDFFGYRMDFTMKFQRHGVPVFLCIEADGARYHNDTKDEERDAKLNRRGVKTLRFSGAAIHKDMVSTSEHINTVATEIELNGSFKGHQE